jgi:hypothetical protein
MKGRFTAIFLSAVALLSFSICMHAQDAGAALRSAHKSKKIAHSSQNVPPLKGNTYLVRPGDSLIKIARNFKTTPAALISENKLKSKTIKIDLSSNSRRTKWAGRATSSSSSGASRLSDDRGALSPERRI